MAWGAQEYPLEIARGGVQGAQLIASSGKRSALAGEIVHVIWPNGEFQLPPSSGVQMSISSTDITGDDAPSGDGARSIMIHYLDANLEPNTEIIVINGDTPQLTEATDIRFIQCMHLKTWGVNKVATGDITAKYDPGSGPITYSQITAGKNRCTSSARMVPAGKKCFVAGAVGGASSGTAAASAVLDLVASELDGEQYLDDQFILFAHAGLAVQDNSEAYTFPVPIPFQAGTVIALAVTTDKNATVTGSWFGWLENT
ncbi:MAG: hypothetical protein ACFE8Z_10735, partial [Candidatus Hermodarchaeota archaeon]